MSLMTLERRGAVALLTLNRPEAMNTLGSPGDGDAIAAVCAEVNADRGIRCAILTGAGRAFSAGGDIKAMRARAGAFGGSGATFPTLPNDAANTHPADRASRSEPQSLSRRLR